MHVYGKFEYSCVIEHFTYNIISYQCQMETFLLTRVRSTTAKENQLIEWLRLRHKSCD